MKIYATLFAAFAVFFTQAQVIDLPDMNSIRSGHELICLEGEVLVALGGYDDSNYLSSVEVYDGDSWSDAEAMSVSRYSFTAHATGPDEVVVIGGWDGIQTNHASTEIFYPGLDAWDEGPTLTFGRSNHRSIRLNDGRILVTGGYDGIRDLVSCEIIDPLDWSVSTADDMNFGRSSHELILLDDGRVLAIGGFNPTFDFQLDECEIYDPESDTWTNTGMLASGRDNFAAFILPDGDVVAAGGRFFNGDLNLFEGQSMTEIYDVVSGTWSSGGELANGASYCDAYWVGAADEAILLSGTDQSGSGVTTTFSPNQFNMYGPDSWAVAENSLTGDRFRFASCQRMTGAIVISGGVGSTSVQVINPAVGVEESSHDVLQIFPNPASDRVAIRTNSDISGWQLFGLDGRVVLEGRGKELDVQAFSPGSYQLVIQTADRRFSETLLVH